MVPGRGSLERDRDATGPAVNRRQARSPLLSRPVSGRQSCSAGTSWAGVMCPSLYQVWMLPGPLLPYPEELGGQERRPHLDDFLYSPEAVCTHLRKITPRNNLGQGCKLALPGRANPAVHPP